MKRILTLVLSLIVSALLVGSAFPVYAHDAAEGILNLQYAKESVDHPQALVDRLALTPADGREWYILALTQAAPELDFSRYASALMHHLTEKGETNPVTRQKLALVLLACGYDAELVTETANACYDKLGVMSRIFALHLANAGKTPDGVTVDTLVNSLLSLVKPDGGFAVTGERGDVDVTAMALQALAPHVPTRKDVSDAVSRALAMLGERQTENGGFLAYGEENAESAAQVLIALVALGIDPSLDGRFIKNGHTVTDALLSYKAPSGAFTHVAGSAESESATMQAYLALTALTHQASPYPTEHTVRTFLTPETAHEKEPVSYRVYAILAVLAVASIACAVLFLCKKRNIKTHLTVAALALVAVVLVLVTDVKTPETYYGDADDVRDPIGTVTLTVECKALIGKADGIPEDGVILAPTTVAIASGDTVYDVLARAVRKHRIHMETKGTGELVYVEGIAHLYELQHGDLSGWVYTVNGADAAVGCGSHAVSDGDTVVWRYTTELGTIGEGAT